MNNTGLLNIELENLPVRIAAIRPIPKIEGIGITIKAQEAGREFEVPFWIAQELMNSGLARIVDEGISSEEWTQIHFRERFNPVGPLTSLPENFYRRAYSSLAQAKKGADREEGKREVLNRLKARYRDILESRIGKVVRMATAESVASIRNLEPEEAKLFNELKNVVGRWREEMRALVED